MTFDGLQTRCTADSALNIHRGVTHTANQVVMVVTYPVFIERRPPRRFNPSQDSSRHQGVEVVIDGLSREVRNAGSGRSQDEFGILVFAFVLNSVKDRQSRRCQAEIRPIQQVPHSVVHRCSLPTYLYIV